MAASSSLPLVIAVAVAVFLLLLAASASAVPAAAAGGKYGGRMVIIRGHGTSSVAGGAAGARRQQYRRLEDEVAPELAGVSGLLLGAGDGSIGYDTLHPDSSVCQRSNTCAGKQPGGPYTGNGCTYRDHCPH